MPCSSSALPAKATRWILLIAGRAEALLGAFWILVLVFTRWRRGTGLF